MRPVATAAKATKLLNTCNCKKGDLAHLLLIFGAKSVKDEVLVEKRNFYRDFDRRAYTIETTANRFLGCYLHNFGAFS